MPDHHRLIELGAGFLCEGVLCHVLALELVHGTGVTLEIVVVIAVYVRDVQTDSNALLVLNDIGKAHPCECVLQILQAFSQSCFCKLVRRFIRPQAANQRIIGADRAISVDEYGK